MCDFFTAYKKRKENWKPIHQIKLCKLHSDVAQVPTPFPLVIGIFTFSSSVQDGAKIEKDTSSYKEELNEISVFD